MWLGASAACTGQGWQDADGFVGWHGGPRLGAVGGAFELVVAHLAFDRAGGGRPVAGVWAAARSAAPRSPRRTAAVICAGGNGRRRDHLAAHDPQAANERQPIRVQVGLQRGGVHHRSQGVVDQQVRPHLLGDQRGSRWSADRVGQQWCRPLAQVTRSAPAALPNCLILITGAIKWGDANFAFAQLRGLRVHTPWPPP
jgi:hypothetical protein